MFKAVLLLAGLIVVMLGLTVAQDGHTIVGAVLAAAPIAALPVGHAVLEWHDGKPQRPPRAVVVRRRAS